MISSWDPIVLRVPGVSTMLAILRNSASEKNSRQPVLIASAESPIHRRISLRSNSSAGRSFQISQIGSNERIQKRAFSDLHLSNDGKSKWGLGHLSSA